MTTSNPGARNLRSPALLSAVAAVALAGCSVIAPLEEVDRSPGTDEGSTQGSATERDGGGDGDSSPPAKKKDAGSAHAGDDGSGGDEDVTPPSGGASRAGRSGGTRSRAGTGGSNTAGSGAGGPAASDAGTATDAAAGGAGDAGTPTRTSSEPACDPAKPQQPRPPLTACAAGQACLLHEDQAQNGMLPTTCGQAGSTALGATCSQDADCTVGHICDSFFHICLQLCGVPEDCDDNLCPPLPGRTIGTSGLTIGICGAGLL